MPVEGVRRVDFHSEPTQSTKRYDLVLEATYLQGFQDAQLDTPHVSRCAKQKEAKQGRAQAIMQRLRRGGLRAL